MDLSELIDRMLMAGNAMAQELQEIADDGAQVSQQNCLALIADWDSVLQEKSGFTCVEKPSQKSQVEILETKTEEGEGIC